MERQKDESHQEYLRVEKSEPVQFPGTEAKHLLFPRVFTKSLKSWRLKTFQLILCIPNLPVIRRPG